MQDFSKFKKSLLTIDHYIYALCEIDGEKRTPFYIGKGVNDRCLQHLKEKKDSPKKEVIERLLEKNTLGIDILRHGIKTDKTAKLIEATCIDLLVNYLIKFVAVAQKWEEQRLKKFII